MILTEARFIIAGKKITQLDKVIMDTVTAMVYGYLVTNLNNSKVRILLKLLSLLVDKREDNTLQLT